MKISFIEILTKIMEHKRKRLKGNSLKQNLHKKIDMFKQMK